MDLYAPSLMDENHSGFFFLELPLCAFKDFVMNSGNITIKYHAHGIVFVRIKFKSSALGMIINSSALK